MSVENMGNGYVKVGVKQEDLEASIAGLRQLKPILQAREYIGKYINIIGIEEI